jgi:hypothetical protein
VVAVSSLKERTRKGRKSKGQRTQSRKDKSLHAERAKREVWQ